MIKFYSRPISLALQKIRLQQTYTKLIDNIEISRNCLSCRIRLKPSECSRVYHILIKYKLKKNPEAWIIKPEIENFHGKRPPHIYKYNKKGFAKICVFCPQYKEWDGTKMLLSKAFVPWIVTWLNTYEYRILTGEWYYDEVHLQ